MEIAENETEANEWQYDVEMGIYYRICESGWVHLTIDVYRRSEASDDEPGMAWGFKTSGTIATHGKLDVPSGATPETAQDAAKVKVSELLKLKVAHYEEIIKRFELGEK